MKREEEPYSHGCGCIIAHHDKTLLRGEGCKSCASYIQGASPSRSALSEGAIRLLKKQELGSLGDGCREEWQCCSKAARYPLHRYLWIAKFPACAPFTSLLRDVPPPSWHTSPRRCRRWLCPDQIFLTAFCFSSSHPHRWSMHHSCAFMRGPPGSGSTGV